MCYLRFRTLQLMPRGELDRFYAPGDKGSRARAERW